MFVLLYMVLRYFNLFIFIVDRLGGVMVAVLASSVEGRGFDPRPGQTIDIKIFYLLLLR